MAATLRYIIMLRHDGWIGWAAEGGRNRAGNTQMTTVPVHHGCLSQSVTHYFLAVAEMLLNGGVECEGESRSLCGFCFSAVIRIVMAEYTSSSHPQSVSLSPEVFGVQLTVPSLQHFPRVGCIRTELEVVSLSDVMDQQDLELTALWGLNRRVVVVCCLIPEPELHPDSPWRLPEISF